MPAASPRRTAQPPPTAPPIIAPLCPLLCASADTVIVVFTVTVAGGAVVDALFADEGGNEEVGDEDGDEDEDDGGGPGVYAPGAVVSAKSVGRSKSAVMLVVPTAMLLLTLSGNRLGESNVERAVLLRCYQLFHYPDAMMLHTYNVLIRVSWELRTGRDLVRVSATNIVFISSNGSSAALEVTHTPESTVNPFGAQLLESDT